MQNEIANRTERLTELQALTEVSALANLLKDALLDTSARLQQKQQVLEVYGNMEACMLYITHHVTVAGHA